MNCRVRKRTQNASKKASNSRISRLRLRIYLVRSRRLFRVAGRKTEPFLDHVKWTPFDFRVDPAKVFAEDAERDELHAAHEEDRDEERGPTAREALFKQPIQNRDDNSQRGNPDGEKAGPDRELQRHE